MGKCLIINLQENERPGSKEDVKNMNTLFTNLCFEVTVGGESNKVCNEG